MVWNTIKLTATVHRCNAICKLFSAKTNILN